MKEGVSADGTWTLRPLPAGNYTLNLQSNEDFVSAHINVVVQANACSERDVTMSTDQYQCRKDEGLLPDRAFHMGRNSARPGFSSAGTY